MRYLALFALLVATTPIPSLATQSLGCTSETFAVEMAVGSEGDVSGLVFRDKSGGIPDDADEHFAFSKRHRKAWIGRRTIDVEAIRSSGTRVRVRIVMTRGKGTIEVNGKVEPIVCDWEEV